MYVRFKKVNCLKWYYIRGVIIVQDFENENKILFKTATEAKEFIKIVVELSGNFLKSEGGIYNIEVSNSTNDENKLELRDITSMIFLEDKLKITLAFSFDDEMLKYIFKKYSEGLDIEEEEYQSCLEETAGDMINIVLGRALGIFVKEKILFYLSPPIVINKAQNMARYKDTEYYTVNINSKYGVLSILMIIPGESFKSRIITGGIRYDDRK